MNENENLKEKIERWKLKAEVFLKDDIRAFIIDTHNSYYFCDIIFVGEDCIHVRHFKGLKKYEKERIFWADVIRLEEYQPQESEVSP